MDRLRPVLPDDIRWLREQWSGPIVAKGVLRGDEIEQFVDLGVDGVVVSNHGGRNLDGARSTLESLPQIAEAVDGRMEVLLDGGVRHGADIVKAVALGANACLIGRAHLYGLAAGGEAGVGRVIELLRNEVAQTMTFLGARRVQDIDSSLVDARLLAGPVPM